MKNLLIATVLLLVFGFLVYNVIPHTAPTNDLTSVESVVLGLTMKLDAYRLESSVLASCTVPGFAAYVASTTPNWSNVFSDFLCDLKVNDNHAIFIVHDRTDKKLLFEDGTWSTKLDAPHWRIPNLPRLQFPIASGAQAK